jgi:hypothetical protein
VTAQLTCVHNHTILCDRANRAVAVFEKDPSKAQEKSPTETQLQYRCEVPENQRINNAGSDQYHEPASFFENTLPDIRCVEAVRKRYRHDPRTTPEADERKIT